MSKTFRPYPLDQRLLLPPDLREWLPEDHLALFVSDVIDSLELSAIFHAYEQGDGRGQPPYDPALMVKLLVYAYCTGKPSSRKIERATYEEVTYRVLAADQHPDHASIAEFRRRHLQALAGLFLQVLRLCQAAGLVKLGHVALDGTKLKANASKHKAMSYGRMAGAEQKLEEEVQKLLEEAQMADAAEDARYGKGKGGDELPMELARRESRLRKIREAKAALEQEAKEQAREAAVAAQAKIAERQRQEAETGQKAKGRTPLAPDPAQARPEPKAQRNFTDPDSRIMKDGATKSFEQAYNAQVVVDSHAQIIVAAAVTQEANDKQQLVPMLGAVQDNVGELPQKASADAGFFSEANLTDERVSGVDLYVPPDRQHHDPLPAASSGAASAGGPVREQMRHKLKTPEGAAVYKLRKAIVEPVFGQIKEGRGFRRFAFRGLAQVAAEWAVICLTHNLLKLFRAQQGAWAGV
jgi:transposase